jgi:hypothetical protein
MKATSGEYVESHEIEDGKIVARIQPEDAPAFSVPIGLLPDRAQEGDMVSLRGIVKTEGTMIPPKERMFVLDRIEAGEAVLHSWRGDGSLVINASRLPNPHEGGHYEIVFFERPKLEEEHAEDLEQLQEDLMEKPEDEK